MRAFVAVDVPTDEATVSRTAPAHLTLRFLGEISAERVSPIVTALGEVGRHAAPFAFRLEGVGAFPSADRPRIVWIGVTEGRGELARLAEEVREALRGEGDGRPEGAFVPHLTWFRVRSAIQERAARDLLTGRVPSPPPRTVEVRELRLKESALGPGAAVHRTIGVVPLSAASAPG